MTGVLVIDATVDVAQFWPSGESDADTVKLTLSSPGNAFRFRSSPGAPAVITHAFDKAGMFETVKGKRTFKPLIRNGVITTRLQGYRCTAQAEPDSEAVPPVGHLQRAVPSDACDVGDPVAVKQTFESIESDLGSVDVLIYNAGKGVRGSAEEVTLEDFEAARHPPSDYS